MLKEENEDPFGAWNRGTDHARVDRAPAPAYNLDMAGIRLKSGLTEKQEAFCEHLLAGHTQADAYKLAYDTHSMTQASIYQLASRLVDNVNIKSRIDAMRQERMYRSSFDKDRVIHEAHSTYQLAQADSDWSASLQALRLIAQLNGLIVSESKSTVTVQHESALSKLPLSDLLALAANIRQRLGMPLVVEGQARELPAPATPDTSSASSQEIPPVSS